MASYDSSCVLWLQFDEGSGNIVYDQSGNNNNGTIYGATFVDSPFNKALSFDGVDDYVEIPTFSLPFPKTVLFWGYFFPKSGFQHIISKCFGGSVEFVTQFEASFPQPLRLYGWNGTATFFIGASNTLFNTNTWYHIAIIYSNPTTYIYVNGILDKAITPAYTLVEYTSAKLRIGSRYPDNTAPFRGLIDEVRIYNRALSDLEIAQIYHDYIKHKKI